MFTIYHNPRCSKSRQTLALLEEKAKESNQEITIIEYLKKPLSSDDVQKIQMQLDCSILQMMRTKEAEFTEQELKGANEAKLINAIVNTPKLMERPIVTNGSKAIIGRPPENVLTFF